jgi:DNA-binding transcriptional LysR family regulator
LFFTFPFISDMRITHRQVEVFRALMLAGGVTKAAEMLFTSQPTVSRELARLEQLFGFVLFERTGGRLRPTLEALSLFEEVKRTYVGLEGIASAVDSLRKRNGGWLSILTLPVFSHALLPGACKLAFGKHPGLTLSIETQESPLLEEWLSSQRFDLGLTENDVAPAGTTLTSLFEANVVCVLPDGHPLLEKRVLALSDFAGQAFLSLSANDPYRLQIDKAFAEQGVERRMVAETPSAVSLCSLVQKGLGIAVVNPLTALDFHGRQLNIRPLKTRFPYRVGIVQPQHRPLNPMAGIFMKALQEEAAALKHRLTLLARAGQ